MQCLQTSRQLPLDQPKWLECNLSCHCKPQYNYKYIWFQNQFAKFKSSKKKKKKNKLEKKRQLDARRFLRFTQTFGLKLIRVGNSSTRTKSTRTQTIKPNPNRTQTFVPKSTRTQVNSYPSQLEPMLTLTQSMAHLHSKVQPNCAIKLAQ